MDADVAEPGCTDDLVPTPLLERAGDVADAIDIRGEVIDGDFDDDDMLIMSSRGTLLSLLRERSNEAWAAERCATVIVHSHLGHLRQGLVIATSHLQCRPSLWPSPLPMDCSSSKRSKLVPILIVIGAATCVALISLSACAQYEIRWKHVPVRVASMLSAQALLANAQAAHADQNPKPQSWFVPLSRRLHKRAALDIPSPGPPPTIPITDALPSTLHLASSLLQTWDESFVSLSTIADELTRESLKRIGLSGPIRGVPGTGIVEDVEARALQDHLDCMSGKGEWTWDEKGAQSVAISGQAGLAVHKQESIYASCDRRYYKGREGGDAGESDWDVRSSLKWKWVPSPSCKATAPMGVPHTASLSRRQFCRLLAHKSILVVGDTPHYSLHDMLLDWTSLVPQSCYGDLYCKEHALCGDILRSETGVEDWENDERVYNRLPVPPTSASTLQKRDNAPLGNRSEAVEKRAVDQARSPSYGTMLRYRRSDGLRPASAQTHPTYAHPSTGVREINQQWLADSRRSDVVILSKAPLPLPIRGYNETWDRTYFPAMRRTDVGAEAELEKQAQRMLQAAYDVTVNVWLPELLEALRAVRGSPSPTTEQLVVYRGGWRSHHDCAASMLDDEDNPASTWMEWAKGGDGDGPPPHTTQPSLAKLIFRSIVNGQGQRQRQLVNEHTLFFNLQTILQNFVARTVVLPAFGIPFLDHESMLSVWRSGMVGSSAGATFQPTGSSSPSFVDQSQAADAAHGIGVGLRSAASGDCSRYCVPSPGSAIEEAFIGGLLRVSDRTLISSASD